MLFTVALTLGAGRGGPRPLRQSLRFRIKNCPHIWEPGADSDIAHRTTKKDRHRDHTHTHMPKQAPAMRIRHRASVRERISMQG